MILKSSFENSQAQVEFLSEVEDTCLITISNDPLDEYSSCALSKESAQQLAEALLEFTNAESD